MARLKVPDKYKPAIAAISKLDASTILKIRAAIEAMPPSVSPRSLGKALTKSLAPELKEIAEAVGSLYGVKAGMDMTVEEFAEEICDAMERDSVIDPSLLPVPKSQAKDNLVMLLSVDNVSPEF